MFRLIRTLWTDESAQDMAEYGLLLTLIAIAIVAAIVLFRDAIIAAFGRATAILAAP